MPFLQDDNLRAALRYANTGIAVFPCVPGEKRPLVKHGLYDATTDSVTIHRWWARWPLANIAMPTGGAGYDVLDVDVHPSGDGYANLRMLHSEGLLDGWIHTVRTPSGGLHIYYPGSEQRNGKIAAAHVDFRGQGGYVLVPPSVVQRPHGLGSYEAINTSSAPAVRIDWARIRSRLVPRPTPPGRALLPKHGPPRSVPSAKAIGWLARHVAQAKEGNRNDLLFWAACRAFEHGASDPAPLREAARQAGLTEREADATITSAYRTVERSTGHPLARRREPRPAPAGPAL